MSDNEFPIDGRWTCPQCSCFIAESAITEWDERDPGSYYGVANRFTVDCPRCGRLTDGDVLPPRWTPTRWGAIA